jgi:hypothetical protein
LSIQLVCFTSIGERERFFCIKPLVFEFSFGNFGIRTHDTLRGTAPIALPH